jgi:acyl-CoA synthetase (AMP-forming)/AMP-acid ligase II
MEYKSIPVLVKARVNATPDKPFLFSELDGRQWTYEEFDSAVKSVAAILARHGIVKGDVVSLLLPNSAEYIIGYFACWSIGAIAGPINSLLKPEEIEWVITNSESKLLLTSSALSASLNIGVLSGKLRTICIEEFFNSEDPEAVDFPLNSTGELDHESTSSDVIVPDDEAVIIYTSGTTGKPKGCLLTHGNLIANARQITEWLGFGRSDRLLTVMPLFHMNAVTVTTMTALYCGGSTVVSPKFSATRFWEVIERYQITSFGSVATMLSMLLSVDGEHKAAQHSPLTSLRFAMCGSAPVPAEVLKRFEETFGILVIEGYGLSESTCRSTFNPPNENRRPGSCGLPIGNEMRVVGDDDIDVPDGELGEIVMRGPNIFKGYFKNPEATAFAFRNGWFHTGDIGYRDPDGFFHIADRKSDMIIRGGENIYPREIDDLLYTHPAVAHAAVIGVPDELYGEEVTAFIVLKDGASAAEDDIIDFCRQHLADYKCPKTVHFIADIPKGPTGKLLKRQLSRCFEDLRDQKNS